MNGDAQGAELDAELQAVKLLMLETITTVVPRVGDQGWPYDLTDGGERAGGTASTSTIAMIGFAIAALINGLGLDERAPTPLTLTDLATNRETAEGMARGLEIALSALKDLSESVSSAEPDGNDPSSADSKEPQLLTELNKLLGYSDSLTGAAARRVTRHLRAAVDDCVRPGSPLTESSLFGDNDPFTLDWMLRLTKLCPQETTHLCQRINELTLHKIQHVKMNGAQLFRLGPLEEQDKSLVIETSSPPRIAAGGVFVTNIWPLVRLAYLTTQVDQQAALPSVEDELVTYFEAELAQQLGYAEVADSSFDVATLVFALDGLTLLRREALHGGLIDQFIQVVLRSHKIDPRLQPRRPFKSTPTGGVHIAVGIEVFLSLIRLLRRVEPAGSRNLALRRLLPVFMRFTQYLQATVVRARIKNDAEYRGWSSDHEYSISTKIETWYTSQVLLYLAEYGALLRDHTAQLYLSDTLLSRGSPASTIPQFFSSSEVLMGLGRDFALDTSETRSRFSFLLYGPPGTGKTTVVEQVANKLNWDFLAISPSHFVADGGDRVEERASRLFEALGHQSRTVVLFDEIDRLILDRSSRAYGRQGDMFQFMTPSMLTKLNELRRREQVIFAIATNYAWRIDSAILRPGRIDRSYLILPLSLKDREVKIASTIGQGDPRLVSELASKTVLATRTELDALLLRWREPADSHPDPDKMLEDFEPTIRLSAYLADINDPPAGKCLDYLVDEIVGLVSLLDEAGMVRQHVDSRSGEVIDWLHKELDSRSRRSPQQQKALLWHMKVK